MQDLNATEMHKHQNDRTESNHHDMNLDWHWSDVCHAIVLRRINVKTGEVKRTPICQGQNLDHPRVNPLFYSRATRYVYFNASVAPDVPGESGPPQVRI